MARQTNILSIVFFWRLQCRALRSKRQKISIYKILCICTPKGHWKHHTGGQPMEYILWVFWRADQIWTLWCWVKMDAVVLTTFSNAFFFNENIWISINISLRFVPKGPMDNKSTLVQIVTWRRTKQSGSRRNWSMSICNRLTLFQYSALLTPRVFFSPKPRKASHSSPARAS